MFDPLEFKRLQDAKIETLRARFHKTSQDYLTAVKAQVDQSNQVRTLVAMVEAGRTYYRMCEEATLDRDGLFGDEFDLWVRDRIGTAESVLTGLPKYHKRVRKERDRLKLNATMFEPTPGVYQNMQGLLVATRPESALKLKAVFIAENLPVVGFNNPYKPEPAKAPVISKTNNPWLAGSFYLVATIVIISVIGTAVYFLSWYAAPFVIIGAVLFISIIGAFQLRNDEKLSEKGFLALMVETFKRLPLLKNVWKDKKTK